MGESAKAIGRLIGRLAVLVLTVPPYLIGLIVGSVTKAVNLIKSAVVEGYENGSKL